MIGPVISPDRWSECSGGVETAGSIRGKSESKHSDAEAEFYRYRVGVFRVSRVPNSAGEEDKYPRG